MAEFQLYDLRVTVERIEGRSVCGLQVGDYFDLVGSNQLRIPAGKHFCVYALSSVLPLLSAKQRELSANDWMAQDLADMLDLTVERPDFVESTALGAAMLAATGAGLYTDLASAAQAMRGTATRFTPAIDREKRKTRLAGWQSALAKILG